MRPRRRSRLLDPAPRGLSYIANSLELKERQLFLGEAANGHGFSVDAQMSLCGLFRHEQRQCYTFPTTLAFGRKVMFHKSFSRRLAVVLFGAIALLAHSLPSAHADVSKGPCAVTKLIDVPAKMRDGVTLLADVYRPIEAGSYPVILMRLPLRQGRRTNLCLCISRVLCVALLHCCDSGCTWPIRFARHVLRVSRRDERWLRQRRMGRRSPWFKRQGWNVWVFLCRCDAMAGGRDAAASPRGDRAGYDVFGLL
jgi:hypothetical protein